MKRFRKLLFKDLSLAQCLYRLKGKSIEGNYANLTIGGGKIKSSILYCCNKFCMMGGLCDRLQGIVSLYKVSKNSGVPFKIWFDYPFNLADFLIPNKVDWNISKEQISIKRTDVKVFKVPIAYKALGMTYQEECAYQIKFFSRLFDVYKRNPKQLHFYTNAHLAIYDEFESLFNELFKPSPILKKAIDANMQKIGGEYVSATFRFQNLLGDFQEGNSQELSYEEKQMYISRCLDQIERIHLQYPTMKILVTADSTSFLKEANTRYPYVYIIPGNLVHMSYVTNASSDTYLKSFTDLMMLANARKLFLLITGKMYHSGFAQTASFIHNKPYEVIKF